jgi:hypothetical protein
MGCMCRRRRSAFLTGFWQAVTEMIVDYPHQCSDRLVIAFGTSCQKWLTTDLENAALHGEALHLGW